MAVLKCYLIFTKQNFPNISVISWKAEPLILSQKDSSSQQRQHSTVTTADSGAWRNLSTSYPPPSTSLSKKMCFTIIFQRGKAKAHYPVWQVWLTAPYATQPHSFRLICKKPPSPPWLLLPLLFFVSLILFVANIITRPGQRQDDPKTSHT